jgi:hypothetical protein
VIVPLAASARGSHLHRFDHHDVVAIGSGSSHCTGIAQMRPATSVTIFIFGMPIPFCCRRKMPEVASAASGI